MGVVTKPGKLDTETDLAWQPRLLFDDQDMVCCHRLKRVMCRPTPYPGNPLLVGAEYIDRVKLNEPLTDHPDMDQHANIQSETDATFEVEPMYAPNLFGRFALPTSVIQNPTLSVYQMYYEVFGGIQRAKTEFVGGNYYTCYAESTNGMDWHMPRLNQIEVDGCRENNLIFEPPSQAYVVYDPRDEDENRRYKAFSHPGPRIATSRDGRHWSAFQDARLETQLGRSDGDTFFGWDPQFQKYVAFFRPWRACAGAPDGAPFHRRIGRATSDDLLAWSDHQVILSADYEAGEAADLERMHVVRYGDRYLGLVNVLSHVGEERKALSFINAPCYIELAYSRDGLQWYRFDERDPFISCIPGRRDRGCVMGSQGFLQIDQQLHFYYGRSAHLHGMLANDMTMHVARLTRDRFVGWRNDADEDGVLQTPYFVCPGGELIVNADTIRGTIRIAVLLEDGLHEAERAMMRCVYVNGDGIEHRVRWQRVNDLDDLKGKRIALRFYIDRATLYAYRFAST